MSEANQDILEVGLESGGYYRGAQLVRQSNEGIKSSCNSAQASIAKLESSLSSFGRGAQANLGAAKQALVALTAPSQGVREMLDSILHRIVRIGATIAVFRALHLAVQGLVGALREGLKYLSLIETATLGIASSFLVVGNYVDRVTGKVTSGHTALLHAQKDSREAIDQLRVANMNTLATLDQLIVGYQTALPIAIRKGFDKKQVVDFTTAVYQMAGAIGQPFDQMSEEIRSLLGASPITKNSRMAAVLGLRPADMAQFKNDTKGLFDFIMSRMEPFRVSGIESQKTFAGLFSNLKDIGKVALGHSFEGVFQGLKKEMAGVLEQFVTFDNVTKQATWNKEWISSMKAVGKTFKEWFDSLANGAKFLIEYGDRIMAVTQILVMYKAAMILAHYVQARLSVAHLENIGILSGKAKTLAMLDAVEQKHLTTKQLAIALLREQTLAEVVSRTEALAGINAAKAQEVANRSSAAASVQKAQAEVMGIKAQIESAEAANLTTAAYMRKSVAEKASIAESMGLQASLAKIEATNAAQKIAHVQTAMALQEKEIAALATKSSLTRAQATTLVQIQNAEMANLQRLIALEGEAAAADSAMAIAKAEYAAASRAANAAINEQAATGMRYLANVEARIALTQQLSAAEAKLTAVRIRSIETDGAADTAAIRHNMLLRERGVMTGWVTAAELRKVQTSFLSMSTEARETAVTEAHSAALAINTRMQNANSLASRAATVARTAASGALALVGGPLGAITLALMAGYWAWDKWGNRAEKALKQAQAKREETNEIINGIKEEIRQKEAAKKLDEEMERKKKDGTPVAAKTQLEAALGSNYAKYQELINSAKDKLVKIQEMQKNVSVHDVEAAKKLNELRKERFADLAQAQELAAVSLKNNSNVEFVPDKPKPPEPTFKENYSKEKTLDNAYIAYVEGFYADKLNLMEAQAAKEKLVLDNKYKNAEIAQRTHLMQSDMMEKEAIQKEIDNLDRQKKRQEELLRTWKAKTPGGKGILADATDADGLLVSPAKLALAKEPGKNASEQQKQDYKNMIAAYAEYYKISQDINKTTSEIAVKKENIKTVDLTTGQAIKEMQRESLFLAEDQQIEAAKQAGNELRAFDLVQKSARYKFEVLTVDKLRLEAAEAHLRTVSETNVQEHAAAQAEVANAKAIITSRDRMVAIDRDRLVLAKEIAAAETARIGRESLQSVSAFNASQTYTDGATGIVKNEYLNALAVEDDRSRSAIDNMNKEWENQQRIMFSQAASREEAAVALQKMLDLERQITMEKIKSGQIKAGLTEKETIKGYEQLAATAQKTWPKITAFQTAAHLITKKYATEEIRVNQDGTKTVIQSGTDKMAMVRDYTAFAGEMLQNLAAAEDQTSRKGFETAKNYNTAAAVMSTAAAVVNALATVQPWPAAVAAAGVAAALGAVQVAKIQSTSFGGGGSVAGVSSGSFGGGGGPTQVGGSIGKEVYSAQDTQSAESLKRLAESSDNASLAIGKVADGMTDIAEMLKSGTGQNFSSMLMTGGMKEGPGVMSQVWGDMKNGMKFVGADLLTGGANGLADMMTGGMMSLMTALTSFTGRVFGWGNKWKDTAQGLSLGMEDGELSAQGYIDSKKSGGWLGSDKKKTRYTAVDGQITDAINGYLDQIETAVARSATAVGADFDFSKAQLETMKIKTSGRSEEDIQKDLEKYFQSAADSLAKTTEGLKEFAFYGENAFTAIVRLATSLQGVNEVLELTGANLIKSTLVGADAAYRLAEGMGGLEDFTEAVNGYFDSMFTESEQNVLKLKQDTRITTTAFNEMNLVVPKTKEEFKNLVNSLDLTTEGGASLYISLMKVAPAFAEMIDLAEEFASATKHFSADLEVRRLRLEGLDGPASLVQLRIDQEDEMTEAIKNGMDVGKLKIIQDKEWAKAVKEVTGDVTESIDDLINKSKSALMDMIDARLSIAETMKTLKTGPLANLSPEAAYEQSRDSFTKLIGKTDLASLKALPGAATEFLNNSKQFNATGAAYQADYDMVMKALGGSLDMTTDPTLEAINESITWLQNIKKAVDEGSLETVKQLATMLGNNSPLAKLIATWSEETEAKRLEGLKVVAQENYNKAVDTYKSDIATIKEDFASGKINSYEASHQAYLKYSPVQTAFNEAKEAGVTGITSPGIAVISPQDRDTGKLLAEIKTKLYNEMSGDLMGAAYPPFEGTWYMPSIHEEQDFTADQIRQYYNEDAFTQLDRLISFARTNHLAGYAKGTSYVPFDMTANIHQGEIIVDKASSDVLRKYGIQVAGSGGDNSTNEALLEEVRLLRAEVAALKGETVRNGRILTAVGTQLNETGEKGNKNLEEMAQGATLAKAS